MPGMHEAAKICAASAIRIRHDVMNKSKKGNINDMNIRRAVAGDVPRVLELLSQVLEIHAQIRPDIFVPGTTKYSAKELEEIFQDESRPVYVAADEEDKVLGYAFCVIRQQPASENMVPFTSIYIDDLCVDASARRMRVGQQLFAHVLAQAKELGCYEVTLNVWEGNDAAKRFYENMGMKPQKTQMELIIR